METRALSLVMAPNQKFWNAHRLLPGWAVGELLSHWEELPKGLPVILSMNHRPAIGGRVDDVTSDGSTLWIQDDEGLRRMIHKLDGYTVSLAVSQDRHRCTRP